MKIGQFATIKELEGPVLMVVGLTSGIADCVWATNDACGNLKIPVDFLIPHPDEPVTLTGRNIHSG